MYFQTQFSWIPDEGETNCGISIVDPSGYIKPKDQIENLIRAGERLDEFRREMYDYDFNQEIFESEEFDEMREPGLDLADIHRIRQDALRRLSSQAAIAKRKAESERTVAEMSDASVTEQSDNMQQADQVQ